MAHDTLYIVDNSSEKASVKNYLSEWCSISKQMDIATGYFEIGGLLTLGEDWQKLDKIRIILGNEVTKRTKDIIEEVAQTMIERFRTSMEREHEKNEFLIGVPAIIKAMKAGKIERRVYDSNKFHAKAYITYFRDEYRDQFISAMNIPLGYALVGSSNFTKAGLTQNIELNVQVKDEVEQLQKWFDEHWQNGTDITEAVLKVMEMHCREFSPYDVYLRSMYEYFKSHEETVSEWEENESVVYKELSQYQKDGYNSLIQIAERYSGAFLCDGVGLGKTYVGMMLIERFVKKERKNVVLIVPASARV
uniref:phospholipase D-like domain-containing protein n=1 Tax=uncultured Ruminococcus sp. TaxID=165186 RepID=UPI0025FF872F